MMLQDHTLPRLQLSVANPKRAIRIEFKGSFDVMALYGAELTDE